MILITNDMGNYATLKAAIQDVVKTNHNNAITGALLQQALLAMINSLGVGYQYMGVATPETNPGTPDQRVFYFALTPGVYSNFGAITIGQNEISILKYDTGWTKDIAISQFATNEQISELEQKIGDTSEYSGYRDVIISPIAGYYYSFTHDAPVSSSIGVYVSIPVVPGEQYKISGFNHDSGAPLAMVRNSISGAKLRAISQSSGGSMTGEYTIPAGYDTLIVNGRSNVPISIQKWVVGSVMDAIADLDETKVDKIAGKQLSTNDFTDRDKEIVGFVDNNAVVVPESHGKNYIDKQNLISGYRIVLANNGIIYADSSYSYAEIDVSGIDNIVVSSNVSLSSGCAIAKYNGTTFISGINAINTQDSTTGRFYASMDVSDATVVRMSLLTSVWNLRLIMIESGNTPTSYEPYYIIPAAQFFKLTSLPVSVISLLGSGAKAVAQQMVDNSVLTIPAGSVRKNQRIHFYSKIGTFNKLYVGKGLTEKGYILSIDNTNIQMKAGEDSPGGTISPHGLTISTYIEVIITIKANANATIRISTLGGVYERTISPWSNVAGNVVAKSIGCNLTECILSWSSSDFRKPVWTFGDSYLSHYSESRWPYYMIIAENNDSCLLNAFPGENSPQALNDILEILNYGSPKLLVWCMGMNDPDNNRINPDWLYCVQRLISYCETNGATLILSTIPNVPNYTHTYKNAWVRSSGFRYIDFAKAVGAENAGSNWINGTLSTDNVHPTPEGAKLLCARALADVPEFLGQVM